jgi:hypothetical protein
MNWTKITTAPFTNALYTVCAQAADNIFIGAASVTGTTQRVSSFNRWRNNLGKYYSRQV